MMHICISKLDHPKVSSNNGLPLIQCQDIICINYVLMLIQPLAANLSETWIKTQQFFQRNEFENIICKMTAILFLLNVPRLPRFLEQIHNVKNLEYSSGKHNSWKKTDYILAHWHWKNTSVSTISFWNTFDDLYHQEYFHVQWIDVYQNRCVGVRRRLKSPQSLSGISTHP